MTLVRFLANGQVVDVSHARAEVLISRRTHVLADTPKRKPGRPKKVDMADVDGSDDTRGESA